MEKIKGLENLVHSFDFSQEHVNISKLGNETYITLGNAEEIRNYGFMATICYWGKNEMNRIIISMGQTPDGKSIYTETRDQEILDMLLYEDTAFTNWLSDQLEPLENKYHNQLLKEKREA